MKNMQMIDRLQAAKDLKQMIETSEYEIDYALLSSENPFLEENVQDSNINLDGLMSMRASVNETVETLGFTDKKNDIEQLQLRAQNIEIEYENLKKERKVFETELKKYDEICLTKPGIRRWTSKILA